MSVRIDYGGVAIGAKNDFAPTITDKANFVDVSELQQDGLTFLNYGNPCELYSVALDGNVLAFPSNTNEENLGWWSEQISGADGVFSTPIEATFESTGLYTSSGITFTFDTYNGVYATSINIKWYRDDTLLSDINFTPDSAFYFCSNKVEFYNKLIIVINSINMPYNRLKLRSVEYGMKVSFYGDELRNAKIIQEIDPISTQIPINTCDFTLDSKRNIEFAFEERQPINVYFNDVLKSTSFVKGAKRKSKNIWEIQSEDYIGLMGDTLYQGGIYKNKNAVELLTDIFTIAKVPYTIDGSFDGEVVTGHIPFTTCREALMQVVFAIGAAVDTSNSDVVKVYKLNEELTQAVTLHRIMQGQNFVGETRVTSVEVTAHTYAETDEIAVAYDSAESGEGNNISVIFNQPLYGLTITNGDIISSGANHAYINAFDGCKLTGKTYNHTRTIKAKKNPLVLVSDSDNIVSIENATLISSSNIDKTLEKCYNYLAQNNKIFFKIVEGKHEVKGDYAVYGQSIYGQTIYGVSSIAKSVKYDVPVNVGDVIACETEYLGDITGRIIKQSYGLNGGILIKDTTMQRRG